MALLSPVSPTDYTLQDTNFSQQYCWYKSSETLSHQLAPSYWCSEGAYCLHSLGQEGTKILQTLANIYQSTRHNMSEDSNVRLHTTWIDAKQQHTIHANLHLFWNSGTCTCVIYSTHFIWWGYRMFYIQDHLLVTKSQQLNNIQMTLVYQVWHIIYNGDMYAVRKATLYKSKFYLYAVDTKYFKLGILIFFPIQSKHLTILIIICPRLLECHFLVFTLSVNLTYCW